MHPHPDASLIAALRARGQRVTPQRLLIHRTLRELDRHLTAEEVLTAVGDGLPNTALPPVVERAARRTGLRPDRAEVVMRGLCARCAPA